jgi:hypothetical protein
MFFFEHKPRKNRQAELRRCESKRNLIRNARTASMYVGNVEGHQVKVQHRSSSQPARLLDSLADRVGRDPSSLPLHVEMARPGARCRLSLGLARGCGRQFSRRCRLRPWTGGNILVESGD